MCVPVEMQFMSAPKSVTCTHLHSYFQSTICTQVHKNLFTRTSVSTRAGMDTNGLLTRVINPTSRDFLLKLKKNPIQSSFMHFGQIWSILDRFDPFWTDFIHLGQIWSNLMKKEIVIFIFIFLVQSTMYYIELHISSKSNTELPLGFQIRVG